VFASAPDLQWKAGTDAEQNSNVHSPKKLNTVSFTPQSSQ
jgi:hypothetical protein